MLFRSFQKLAYLQINDEIVKIANWSGLNAYISERNAFGTELRMHATGDLAREIIKDNFFDRNLNSDHKQYRCLAIKNNSDTQVLKNVKLFFNTASRNDLSKVRIAIEEPSSNYYAGSSSTTGITAFSVDALINAFELDYFKNAPIVFNSGQNAGQIRTVNSYIPSSGTIIIDKKLPYQISVNDNFFIDTAAAYRSKSALKEPISNTISNFYDPTQYIDGISININNNRPDGEDLLPKQVIYVWLERSILEINDEYYGNRFSLSLAYSRV